MVIRSLISTSKPSFDVSLEVLCPFSLTSPLSSMHLQLQDCSKPIAPPKRRQSSSPVAKIFDTQLAYALHATKRLCFQLPYIARLLCAGAFRGCRVSPKRKAIWRPGTVLQVICRCLPRVAHRRSVEHSCSGKPKELDVVID